MLLLITMQSSNCTSSNIRYLKNIISEIRDKQCELFTVSFLFLKKKQCVKYFCVVNLFLFQISGLGRLVKIDPAYKCLIILPIYNSFSALCCSSPKYLPTFHSNAAALKWKVPAELAPRSHILLCNNTETVGKLCDTYSLWREAWSILHPPSLLGMNFFFHLLILFLKRLT